MTIEDVANSPESVDLVIRDHEGSGYTLRLLRSHDVDAFGDFLDGLSRETGLLFGPHPLNREAAATVCAELDPKAALRFVLVDTEDRIVGYFIVYPGVRTSEASRFAAAGIELSGETDCTFAPSLADHLQSKGLGSLVLNEIVQFMRGLGFTRMVLSGGTQSQNLSGIAYYTKNGFREVSRFDTEPVGRGIIHNIDMIRGL